MNKIKKLTLLLGVALTLLTPVLGLIPPAEGKAAAASAATGSWWASATTKERVDMYAYIMGTAQCVKENGGDGVSAEDAANYDFFYAGRGTGAVNTGGYLAALVGRDIGDGKLNCGSQFKEISKGFIDMLDGAGVVSRVTGNTNDDGDPIATLCYLGWDRKGKPASDPVTKCISDSGDLEVPEDEKGYVSRLTSDLAGVSTTDIFSSLFTDAEKYYFLSQSFKVLCFGDGGQVLGIYGENATTDNLADEAEADGSGKSNYYKLDLIEGDGTVNTYVVRGEQDRKNNKILGANAGLGKWNPDCWEIARDANKYALKAAALMKNDKDQFGIIANFGEGIDGDPTDDADNSTGPDVKCGGNDGWDLKNWINPLDWLSCSLLQGFTAAAQGFDNLIMGMLCINENDIFGATATCGSSGGIGAHEGNTDEAFHNAWSIFRILALGLLAIGGLVMIISQGLGFEIFDAYTVKKTLPRILVAAIGISLSWEILQFLVALSNGLGVGIRALIYAPFQASGIDDVILGGGASAIAALFAGGAFISLGALGLLSFIGTALLAILIGFFLLVVRNIIVIMLILIAPVAIAAYILPNTEKYYKSWWDWLIKALLVFPIITAFIAVGHVFAAITTTNGGTLTSFVAFAAYFAPYFMIPLAFRFAGGLMATLGGFANDRSRGGFDRLKKFRQGQSARNWENIKAGKRWQGNPVGERLSHTLQTGSLLGDAGYNPARMRDRVRSARSTRISANSAEAEKSAAVRSVLGNDDLLTAALHGRRTEADARAYLRDTLGQRGAALEQNVASIRQAKREMGGQAFEDFAAANLAGTGTGYAGGPAEMFETINRVAGNDRARATRILNSARGQADRAKRIDLSGAGFGTSADQLEWMNNHAPANAAQRTAQHAAVNEIMTDEALNAKSAYEIGTARNGGLVNMAGAVQRRLARSEAALNNAQAAGNAAAIATAEHEYKRILAATAGLHDVASNSSPENAQITGALLGQTSTVGGGGTVLQAIDRYRSDPTFQQYRREYGPTAAAAAAAGAMGGGAPGAGGPAPGGGAAPGGMPPSDRRLKRNITHLETLESGIKLYSFQYMWGGATYVGVMAQDLLKTHPEAVSIADDGFYRVDYSLLGLEMMELQEWLDKSAANIR